MDVPIRGDILESTDGATSPVAVVINDRGWVSLSILVSPRTRRMLEDLEAAAGQPLDAIIGKSIALYKVAIDARNENKAVGIAATPESLETEFVGL